MLKMPRLGVERCFLEIAKDKGVERGENNSNSSGYSGRGWEGAGLPHPSEIQKETHHQSNVIVGNGKRNGRHPKGFRGGDTFLRYLRCCVLRFCRDSGFTLILTNIRIHTKKCEGKDKHRAEGSGIWAKGGSLRGVREALAIFVKYFHS